MIHLNQKEKSRVRVREEGVKRNLEAEKERQRDGKRQVQSQMR